MNKSNGSSAISGMKEIVKQKKRGKIEMYLLRSFIDIDEVFLKKADDDYLKLLPNYNQKLNIR